MPSKFDVNPDKFVFSNPLVVSNTQFVYDFIKKGMGDTPFTFMVRGGDRHFVGVPGNERQAIMSSTPGEGIVKNAQMPGFAHQEENGARAADFRISANVPRALFDAAIEASQFLTENTRYPKDYKGKDPHYHVALPDLPEFWARGPQRNVEGGISRVGTQKQPANLIPKAEEFHSKFKPSPWKGDFTNEGSSAPPRESDFNPAEDPTEDDFLDLFN